MTTTTPVPGAPVARSGLLRTAAATARDVLELALPITCAGCGLGGLRVCPGCAAAWARAPHRCETGAARWDWLEPGGPPPVWALAVNEGPVRRMVVAWKDGGRADLTGWLAASAGRAARWIAADAADDGTADDRDRWPPCPPMPIGSSSLSPPGVADATGLPLLVVPAPASPAGRRRRGEDLVAHLAHAVAVGLTEAGAPARPWPVLRLTGGGDQTRLGARARAANRAGRVRAGRLRGPAARRGGDPTWRAGDPSGRGDELSVLADGEACVAGAQEGSRSRRDEGPVPVGARVLLVDDVLTTGATLAECRRVLERCGTRVAGGLVLAVTRLPGPG
ncbi:MAG TPA: ComF family protein [Cellulomonas sp.]